MVANYLICFVLIAVVIFEIYYVIRRNRLIKIKGKDDLVTFTMIIFFAMLFFPMEMEQTIIESLRNTLAFVAIFGSVGVLRGFSETGCEKFFYHIDWCDIEQITIHEHQVNKACMIVYSRKFKHKLFFNKYKIVPAIRYLQSKNINVLIDNKLENYLITLPQ
ncbi:hypothetical protein [Candidatus Epulonipiscium viviparus]|uniref:hypothetical protein n=1 Tax=Candidatus Epulonipiscium viviparus TaxID=420336 RepID=UPI00016C0D8C|nr:hypothetical protein [Candidatus Epulopiscium viviparus]